MNDENKPQSGAQVEVDKQPIAVFHPQQRGELLHMYTGMLAQGFKAQGGWKTAIGLSVASDLVQQADALIVALEAYHTAQLAKMGAGNPGGADDDRKH